MRRTARPPDGPRQPIVIAPTAEELAAHRDYLAALDRESKGRCVWLRSSRSGRRTAPWPVARRAVTVRHVRQAS